MKQYNEFLNDTNPQIEIEMLDGGVMKLELFPECAPITTQNLLKLIEDKFYDGLIFHRVIKNFMIQGCDPTGTGMGGSAEHIKGEFRANGLKNDLSHTKGVISMARTNNPNSASSQFFICHTNTPHLDGMYAGFGVLLSGEDVLDKIANLEVDAYDRPLKEAKIKTIRRVR